MLVDGELKLSGFKPILKSITKKRWLLDISEQYDNFRADLFMIGLLWLEFLRINKKGFLDDFLSLNDVKKKVSVILKDLSEEKDHIIIS